MKVIVPAVKLDGAVRVVCRSTGKPVPSSTVVMLAVKESPWASSETMSTLIKV